MPRDVPCLISNCWVYPVALLPISGQNMATGIITTDLSAAYDTLDTMLLIMKLEYLGIRGKELELIHTYLEDRYTYVEVQGYP